MNESQFHYIPCLQDYEDPAVGDDDLRRRLQQQTAEGQRKINAVIDKYADKQTRGRASSDSEDEQPRKKIPKCKLEISEAIRRWNIHGDASFSCSDILNFLPLSTVSKGVAKRDDDGGTENDDDQSKPDNEHGPLHEEDSSDVSVVDERYLETESSENEESDGGDCDESMERYGQDRDRPRAEVRVFPRHHLKLPISIETTCWPIVHRIVGRKE